MASAVKYPIGAKLVIIITILLLLSLGAITVLVSVMVSSDVRITAEDNNLTVNARSAAEAETTFATIQTAAMTLADTLSAVGSASEPGREAAKLFFERNADIAFIGVFAGGDNSLFLVNEKYFFSNESDPALVLDFIGSINVALKKSQKGEEIALNVAPVFGLPLLALLFPFQNETLVSIFSSEHLTDSFGTGTNVSFMVSGSGDLLVHADSSLVGSGANLAAHPFVEFMEKSAERKLQTLYTDSDGKRYFGAFTKTAMDTAVITIIEENLVFDGITATTRRNLFLSGAVLCLSVLFVWFFSKTISRPLQELSAAAGRISAGEFDLKLKSKSKDEIGVLTSSFAQMSGALSIFGRFTNREIAVRAMRGEIKPGGTPRHATIFFSDIRDFTAKSEKFTLAFGDEASDRIVRWLNEYLTRMVECVEKTNGVVDKFIGDAVMAHWGTAYTAGSPEEDAFNGVSAALMMREALVEMNRNRSAEDSANPPIRIGCGINTGIVTAGQIGSDLRMEYTVIGDPVNLASRTEALNKALGTDILITEDTWNLTGDKFITEEMPSVRVKGKEKPIRIFAVINHAGAAGSPKTLPAVRKLLGIKAPDLQKVNINAEEKKYKIGGE